ncbi:Alpha-galactosidase [Bienertia sinuspersici]
MLHIAGQNSTEMLKLCSQERAEARNLLRCRGVDYLKYDNCEGKHIDPKERDKKIQQLGHQASKTVVEQPEILKTNGINPYILEVGNGGMTIEEYRSHFSIRALVKAPLLIGCDGRKVKKDNDLESINSKEGGCYSMRIFTINNYSLLHSTQSSVKKQLSAQVDPHAVKMYILTPR